MINFFKFPQEVHLLITFGLGLSVLFQSLALILNYYSQKINAKTLLKFILELAILGEILMFSLQHGQIVGGIQHTEHQRHGESAPHAANAFAGQYDGQHHHQQ